MAAARGLWVARGDVHLLPRLPRVLQLLGTKRWMLREVSSCHDNSVFVIAHLSVLASCCVRAVPRAVLCDLCRLLPPQRLAVLACSFAASPPRGWAHCGQQLLSFDCGLSESAAQAWASWGPSSAALPLLLQASVQLSPSSPSQPIPVPLLLINLFMIYLKGGSGGGKERGQ